MASGSPVARAHRRARAARSGPARWGAGGQSPFFADASACPPSARDGLTSVSATAREVQLRCGFGVREPGRGSGGWLKKIRSNSTCILSIQQSCLQLLCSFRDQLFYPILNINQKYKQKFQFKFNFHFHCLTSS